MSRFNIAVRHPVQFTFEGAPAQRISANQQLSRSVLSCLLWENEFYEDGQSIADRIQQEADACDPAFVASLAVKARTEAGLRHVPLLLLLNLIKRSGGTLTAQAINAVIRRPDEMSELVAMFLAFNPGKGITHAMRKGLAAAFKRFDEYALAKYDREGAVRLRDVLFMAHPKPDTEEQAALFKRVINRELVIPDTWETELSAGKDKNATFTRLLEEEKLGYLALLRNLRNMVNSGVDRDLINNAILARKGAKWVWPFRYVAAARAVPQLEPVIDQALLAAIGDGIKFSGRTAILVDVSQSMDHKLSAKSDMTRADAAATLAAIFDGEQVRHFSFSWQTVEVPPRKGMAGVDAILQSQQHGGTYLGAAVEQMNQMGGDRLIVITDEQSQDKVPAPKFKNSYMINVASARNGVGYNTGWTAHIDGFSESVLRYIHELETGTWGTVSGE